MVELILDTNIWISHIAKDKPQGIFDILNEQLENGAVLLLTTDVIIDEWNRNKENTLSQIESSIRESSRNASKIKHFLPNDKKQEVENLIEIFHVNETERLKLAQDRIQAIDLLLNNSEKAITSDAMKIQVANWALEKRAPFKAKSNSVGDALILLASVEHRKNRGDKSQLFSGFFVSFNHSDYSSSQDSDIIHEDLKTLLDEANLSYKRNIGEVLNLTPDLSIEIENYIDHMIESYIESQWDMHR
jgi:predicted nucleic acid-binding protein